MNIIRISCAVALLSAVLFAVCFPKIGQKTFSGKLEYNMTEGALYLVNDSVSLELSFAYDHASEFITDDFEDVVVTGYYIKLLNVLSVEEIELREEVPSLALAEIY